MENNKREYLLKRYRQFSEICPELYKDKIYYMIKNTKSIENATMLFHVSTDVTIMYNEKINELLNLIYNCENPNIFNLVTRLLEKENDIDDMILLLNTFKKANSEDFMKLYIMDDLINDKAARENINYEKAINYIADSDEPTIITFLKNCLCDKKMSDEPNLQMRYLDKIYNYNKATVDKLNYFAEKGFELSQTLKGSNLINDLSNNYYDETKIDELYNSAKELLGDKGFEKCFS